MIFILLKLFLFALIFYFHFNFFSTTFLITYRIKLLQQFSLKYYWMATFQIPDPSIIISVRSGLPCDFHSDILFLFIQTDLKFNATKSISSVFLFSMMTKHNVQCTVKVLSFALQLLLKWSAINSITFAQNKKIKSAFL